MTSEERNAPPTSDPASAAEISASTADPAAVPPPTPPQALLQPIVPANTEPAVTVHLTPAQVPLPPSDGCSGRIVATLGGRSGHSARASRRQQASDDLTHLLSVASLSDSPPLVEAVVGRLTTISRLRAAKRAELETLHLPDGSAPSPENIGDLLSLA